MHNLKIMATALFLLISAGASYAATAALEPEIGKPYMTLADNRDVVRDGEDGTIVRSSSGACVRTRWSNGFDMCDTQVAAAPQANVRQASSLSREERTVYFGFNQATLSPEMKDRLKTLANVLQSDSQVKGARIVGYADRIGSPGYNEKLSKKRAENVKNYLVAKGYINTQVADTRWLGASAPATECPNNLKRPELLDCLQADRRVEVEIDYTTNTQASR